MSREYLTNVIAYLHGRALEWYLEALLHATAVLAHARARKVSPAAHQEAVTEAERMITLDPEGGIDDTPLMVALRLRLAAQRDHPIRLIDWAGEPLQRGALSWPMSGRAAGAQRDTHS